MYMCIYVYMCIYIYIYIYIYIHIYKGRSHPSSENHLIMMPRSAVSNGHGTRASHDTCSIYDNFVLAPSAPAPF